MTNALIMTMKYFVFYIYMYIYISIVCLYCLYVTFFSEASHDKQLNMAGMEYSTHIPDSNSNFLPYVHWVECEQHKTN